MKKPLLLALILTMTVQANAQTDPPKDPDLARLAAETAKLNAETANMTAVTANLTATQALANAQNPVMIEAARQKAIADAQKSASDVRKSAAEADSAAAKAQLDALKASLPTPTSQAVPGNIAANEKSGYFAQLLAFDALRGLADNIVDEIVAADVLASDNRVYLATNPDQLQATGQRLLIRGKINTYKQVFRLLGDALVKDDKNLVKFQPESLAALAALPALVGTAADVAAFFRQDRTIAGITISPPDAGLMGPAVAGAWLRKVKAGGDKAPPAVSFLNASVTIQVATEKRERTLLGILEELELNYVQLVSKRDETNKRLEEDKLALAKAKDDAAELKKSAGDKPTTEQQAQLKSMAADIARKESGLRLTTSANDALTAVLLSYRTFADSLLTLATGDTQSPLAKVFLNDLIASDTQPVYLLYVSVPSIGGEMEVRKWLWSAGKVYHRAGAVCAYTLYDNSGKVRASGLVAADRQTKEGAANGTFIQK